VDLAGLGAEIRRQLRTRDPNVVVVIRADEHVKYGGLTDLMKIAKEAGAQFVALGTRDINTESTK
jgi:biopolymer transport protein ExbD